ncbi:unnamed protein product [Prorocentrum cordatum]|uniref:Uncharacterized protein n=1 Tax=Prorocentrum cordatum TaxID=2364126 RepID=A0ABN9Q586_9DINO|nr:unnamed protein product [Polarella glacialis]
MGGPAPPSRLREPPERSAAAWRRERCAARLQAFQRRRVALREPGAAAATGGGAAKPVGRYLVDLAEFKEQAKLENQVRLLKAKLEAQEARAAAGTRTPNAAAEPTAEILSSLQDLAAENAKLRVELERQRTENVELRRENQKLRAGADVLLLPPGGAYHCVHLVSLVAKISRWGPGAAAAGMGPNPEVRTS